MNKDFIVLASCTHYNHKLDDLWTLCQDTHSSRLRLNERRIAHPSCTHYNHTILRLHEIVSSTTQYHWVYHWYYCILLYITVLSLLFSVYHLFITAIATDNYNLIRLALTNNKKYSRIQWYPSLLAFFSIPRGDLRPAEIDTRLQKFMLKFKGVIQVEFQVYRRYWVYLYVFGRHRWSYQVSERFYLTHDY